MEVTQIIAMIATLLAPAPRHPLNTDTAEMQNVAEQIKETAEAERVDPAVLTLWIFRESSFRADAERVEDSGAVSSGYGQTHTVAASLCRKVGHEATSIRCAGYLMRYGAELCGTGKSGLWWYVSGKCKGTPRAKRVTEGRLRRAAKLKQEVTK